MAPVDTVGIEYEGGNGPAVDARPYPSALLSAMPRGFCSEASGDRWDEGPAGLLLRALAASPVLARRKSTSGHLHSISAV